MMRVLVFFCAIVVALSINKNGTRPSPATTTRNLVIANGKDNNTQETCKFKGNMYKIGERFFIGCSRCTCMKNNAVHCNIAVCRFLEYVQSAQRQCIFGGKLYQKGNSYKKDSCNFCTCQGFNRFECTKRKCEDGFECFHNRWYKRFQLLHFNCLRCTCLPGNLVMCNPMRRCLQDYMEGDDKYP